MNMKKNFVLVRVGVPGANGVIYSREVLEKALDDLVASDLFLPVSLGGGMKVQDICGQVVEMTINDEELVATVEFVDTDAGKVAMEVAEKMPGSLSVSMSGIVMVDDRGVAKSLTITGMDVDFEGKG